jgi:hypothetical protein
MFAVVICSGVLLLRRSASLASSAVLLAFVAGCQLLDPATYLPPGVGDGDGDGDGSADSCDGPDDLGLSVTTDSLTPVISFTGGAAGLAVSLPAPESSTTLWILSMSGTPFESPVTYGTVPSGALEADGTADALTAATEYWVTLTGGDGSSSECVAWTTP